MRVLEIRGAGIVSVRVLSSRGAGLVGPLEVGRPVEADAESKPLEAVAITVAKQMIPIQYRMKGKLRVRRLVIAILLRSTQR